MKGLWHLAARHAAHYWGRTSILVACLAVPLFLPTASALLVARYERGLAGRAQDTPLVAGAKGSRFDLCLAALHFRRTGLAPIPYAQAQRLVESGEGLAIPLHVGYSAQGWPIVGTTPEYAELRGLALERGRPAVRLGECVLGAEVAQELGLGPGEALFSDLEELYDISKPPALKMAVVGVLAPVDGPDDGAVFCDVKTTWIIAGLGHGHDEVTDGSLDPALVLGQNEEHVTVSPALLEYAEVTPENVGTFHFHDDPGELPLTAIVFLPRDTKAATLAKSRLGRSAAWQMIVPEEIVEELLGLVLRVKSLLDGFLVVLGLCTALLTALVLLLSTRLRAREMHTLERIGAPRRVAGRLLAMEMGLVLTASAAVAAVAVLLVLVLVPDPARILG